jgi:hypothetical protein
VCAFCLVLYVYGWILLAAGALVKRESLNIHDPSYTLSPSTLSITTAMSSLAFSRVTKISVLVPLLGGVVLLVSILSLSIASNGLSHLEQSNPIHTALSQFHNENSLLEGQGDGAPVADTRPVLDPRKLYPFEDPDPNPPLADGHDTFSACMLVMDDNHRLVEWLAYHYHVLPLRHLVVTVDPRSQTSPTWLFNRWRKQGMVVEQWVDRDFWRADLQLLPLPANSTLQIKRDRHRGRQKFFYRSCLIHLKTLNRTWVALHDSDEYLLYNHAGGDRYEAWEARMQKRHDNSAQHATSARIKPSHPPPPTPGEEGGMIRYIRQEQAAGVEYYQSPCIGVPRLSFGAVESSRAAREAGMPQSSTTLDALQFDTLRWHRHAPRNDFVKNALGKVLMDVSRIDVAKSPYFMSLHRPIKSICTPPWHNDWTSGLRINHYLGSWESYAFRDDSRRGGERSREQWEYKATTHTDQTDDNIRPWLQGFVDAQGLSQAERLLDKAGLPQGYRVANESQWNLLPEKLAKILSSDVTIANDSKMVMFDAWVRAKYWNETFDVQETYRKVRNAAAAPAV